MHTYRSLSVLALDAGTDTPFTTVSIRTGTSVKDACTATKTFKIEDLPQLRDLIAWSAEAYAQAFDHLHEDGWDMVHADDCPSQGEGFHAEA